MTCKALKGKTKKALKTYKLKNKKSAQKRFSYTNGGKGDLIIASSAKRRHNAQNRSRRALKASKGTFVVSAASFKVIRKYLKKS